MKRYLCIIDTIPIGHAVNTASHLADALQTEFGHTDSFRTWKHSSLRSVSVKITYAQLEQLKQFKDFVVFKEDAIDWAECGIGFAPRQVWPDFFSKLQLYDGKPCSERPEQLEFEI